MKEYRVSAVFDTDDLSDDLVAVLEQRIRVALSEPLMWGAQSHVVAVQILSADLLEEAMK